MNCKVCDKCGQDTSKYCVRSNGHRFCSGECYDAYFEIKREDVNKERELSSKFNLSPTFDPYYDHALGEWCHSWQDQEAKVKAFNKKQAELPDHLKDRQHPQGFIFANDDHKFIRQCKHDSKNGIDLRRMAEKSAENREKRDRELRANRKRITVGFSR